MDEMRRLIFDSLGLVAFDRQMGLIRQNRDNPDALVLFNMARKVLQYVFELDVKPSMWRYISTPAYRKMMSVLDESLLAAQNMLRETQELLEKRRQSGEEVNSNSMLSG